MLLGKLKYSYKQLISLCLGHVFTHNAGIIFIEKIHKSAVKSTECLTLIYLPHPC